MFTPTPRRFNSLRRSSPTWRVTSFSLVPRGKKTPGFPGSTPPWPGSMVTKCPGRSPLGSLDSAGGVPRATGGRSAAPATLRRARAPSYRKRLPCDAGRISATNCKGRYSVSRVTDAPPASGRRRLPQKQSGVTYQETKVLGAHSNLGPTLDDFGRAIQGRHESRRRQYRTAVLVGPHRNPRLPFASGNDHYTGHRIRAGQRREQGQDQDHRRPRTETARATSRSWILRLIASRLSCCFLPLPKASATLARPFLK